MDKQDDNAASIPSTEETHPRFSNAQAERVIFWATNTDGKCELISANWTQTTGQQMALARGTGWLEAIALEDRAMVTERVQRAIATRSGLYLRYRLRNAEKHMQWILHDASPRFLPSGKFHGLIGTLSDSDDHDGEMAVETSAQRVYDYVDEISLGAIAIGMDGRVVHCNGILTKMLDIHRNDLIGKDWIDEHVTLVHQPQLRKLISGEIPFSELPSELEYAIEINNSEHLFRWHLTLIRDAEGNPISLMMMGNDITQWRRLGDSVRLSARVLETSNEAIMITDRNNNIVSVNASFSTLTGYSAEEVLGKNPRILKSNRHSAEFYQKMWQELQEKGSWRGDIWDRRKDGTVYPKYLAVSTIRNSQDEIINYSAIFHDVTERVAIENRLDHLAHFDPLTDLPNRTLLQDRLEQAIAAADRRGESFAVVFIDLDGFKPINDAHGHETGDEALKLVAQRLRHTLRSMDTAARLGGDEFIAILTDIQSTETTRQVTEKILTALSEPYQIGDLDIRMSASIGVSIYPDDERDANGLLRTADQAMYVGKRGGRNQVVFYKHTD